MADFDWVSARAECSLRKVFFRLTAGAKSDVEKRKEIARANGENVFFESSNEGDHLLVTRTQGAEVKRVEFALDADSITVDGSGANFKATAGLNNTGDCTLMVDGQELDLWQVRRKALEKLFFDEKPLLVVSSRKKV